MYCCSVCMAYYFVYVHLLDHFLEIHWNKIIVFCGFIATHLLLPFWNPFIATFFGILFERNSRFLRIRIHRYPFIYTHLLICHQFLDILYHFLESSWKVIIVFYRSPLSVVRKLSFLADSFIATHSSLPFFGQNYRFLQIHSSLPIIATIFWKFVGTKLSTHSSLPFFGISLERNYRFLRIHCYPFISTFFLKLVRRKLSFLADSLVPIHRYHFLEIWWNKIIVFGRFIATHSFLPIFGN